MIKLHSISIRWAISYKATCFISVQVELILYLRYVVTGNIKGGLSLTSVRGGGGGRAGGAAAGGPDGRGVVKIYIKSQSTTTHRRPRPHGVYATFSNFMIILENRARRPSHYTNRGRRGGDPALDYAKRKKNLAELGIVVTSKLHQGEKISPPRALGLRNYDVIAISAETFKSNLTHLPRHEYVPGIGMGVAKCPYDPADNSTALWVERGNPGGLPALYSGTNAEFTKADTVIFRTDLHNLTTGRREFSFKRTLKYDSKWLDKPNFVGSFDVGEYVLFFFRETAVEYINCGKAVYSRVARVCKRDTGGKNILSQNWATYLKARLNCSIPGEFPFYFNEIQSIYKVPGDDSRFYGVFTTASTGLMGSAICTFTIGDVQKAFEGKFKEQATSSSAWLPVISSRVPEPRPGTCVNDTASLPDTVLNFIRSHPLMDTAVSHENEKPIYYKRDLFFTRLVVDKVKVDMMEHQLDYTVYYAGTSEYCNSYIVRISFAHGTKAVQVCGQSVVYKLGIVEFKPCPRTN
ncbi:Semaphorin-2A [Eumeta japonica]|uniref:Semaphorin-2A n=1 Tax=Eumeta variegata TaxID=151549 RepID=A0A4C2A042_EUMVA|nr:Semaphorin-2A [Eumeta japonica]